MTISKKTVIFYILFANAILFYLSFYHGALRSGCMILSFVLIILNLNSTMMFSILPSLIMAIVTLLMLIISGRMSERGFNAPIENEIKFVFILFIQCAAMTMRLLDRKKKRIILIATFVTISISCLVSVFYAATQDIYAIRNYEEKGFTNVMDFNQTYAVPFAFALILFLLLSTKKIEMRKRLLPIGFLVLSAYFVFVSLYATALMFIGVAIGMSFLPALYRKSKKIFIVFMCTCFLLILLCFLFNQQISDFLYKFTEDMNWIVRARVRSVIDTVFQTDHGNWYNTDRREELANYSLATFMQHPLFGVGYSGYGYGVIGCHQEWYDTLGVFGLAGGAYILFMMIFNTRQVYLYSETQLDKDALLISVMMLAVMGFLNPCFNKQVLFMVYVVAPNLSSLLPTKVHTGCEDIE